MSNEKHSGSGGQKPWTLRASKLLGTSESVVLVLIGVALVLVAVLLLYSSMYDLKQAVQQGPGEIEHRAIQILNTVLLVMMTMEIVYTVAISLESHTLNAEPFLIIGVIACFQGMRSQGGTEGVGRSATSAVVLSSLFVMLADVILVKLILVFFP